MNYTEYVTLTEATEINQDLYRTLLKDVATADKARLSQILDIFINLNVPENYEGDVDEIRIEGLEIDYAADNCAKDIRKYAEMIWLLAPSVSDSLFNVLEQMIG